MSLHGLQGYALRIMAAVPADPPTWMHLCACRNISSQQVMRLVGDSVHQLGCVLQADLNLRRYLTCRANPPAV